MQISFGLPRKDEITNCDWLILRVRVTSSHFTMKRGFCARETRSDKRVSDCRCHGMSPLYIAPCRPGPPSAGLPAQSLRSDILSRPSTTRSAASEATANYLMINWMSGILIFKNENCAVLIYLFLVLIYISIYVFIDSYIFIIFRYYISFYHF